MQTGQTPGTTPVSGCLQVDGLVGKRRLSHCLENTLLGPEFPSLLPSTDLSKFTYDPQSNIQQSRPYYGAKIFTHDDCYLQRSFCGAITGRFLHCSIKVNPDL